MYYVFGNSGSLLVLIFLFRFSSCVGLKRRTNFCWQFFCWGSYASRCCCNDSNDQELHSSSVWKLSGISRAVLGALAARAGGAGVLVGAQSALRFGAHWRWPLRQASALYSGPSFEKFEKSLKSAQFAYLPYGFDIPGFRSRGLAGKSSALTFPFRRISSALPNMRLRHN